MYISTNVGKVNRGSTHPTQEGGLTMLIDKILCALGICRACNTKSDNSGCWGECVSCSKKHGFVSRENLRKYCDKKIDEEIRKAIESTEDTK